MSIVMSTVSSSLWSKLPRCQAVTPAGRGSKQQADFGEGRGEVNRERCIWLHVWHSPRHRILLGCNKMLLGVGPQDYLGTRL